MPKVCLHRLFLLLALAVLLTGCATNRGVVHLDVPEQAAQVQSNGKTVIINTVTDNRRFEENPVTQDIPSLGFGGAGAATEEIKKRAIGRKRNSFGKALGDILLEEGQTVETVIRAALVKSFAEKGYQIVSEQDQTPGTIRVDTSIEKFWSYMTPGFWAITLSADVSTKLVLTVNTGEDVKIIDVTSEDHYQVGTESNYMEVVGQAIQKYIDALKKEI